MKSIEVFGENLEEAMFDLENVVKEYQIVSVDTEFPGFLCNTPRDAGEDEKYRDLKANVDKLKLIQLGITLSNEAGCVGGTWQFNFCNFDPNRDDHAPSSIQLLKKNGINFDRNRREGIDVSVFARRFVDIFSRRRLGLGLAEEDNLQWVTFHGLYDLAYVIKLVTNRPLPPSLSGFLRVTGSLFGDCIYDVKHMARYCEGLLGGELGLDRLAKILKVERFGESHQAGSDSLLTASVFSRINQQYEFAQQMARGFLYGIGPKIKKTSALPMPMPPPGRVIVVPFQPPRYYHHHIGPRCPPSYYPPPLPAYYPPTPPCPPRYLYACNFAF